MLGSVDTAYLSISNQGDLSLLISQYCNTWYCAPLWFRLSGAPGTENQGLGDPHYH